MEDEAEETVALQRSLEMWKADKYLPDLSHNLMCGNALIESQDLDPRFEWGDDEVRRVNAFDWHGEELGFGRILRPQDRGGRGGFDAVVGNPPYIRVQALTEFAPVEVDLYKKLYQTAAEGNYDIYVVFIEKSLRLLREGGRLGYIVPTKWWQAAYGAPLRRLLQRGRHCAEIVDFADEQVFEDPTTYTSIALFTKAPTSSLTYRRMSPATLEQRGAQAATPRWEHAVAWAELGDGPWYPGVRRALRALFDRLRGQGPYLNDPSICPRVFQGLKTSLDAVYVLDLIEERGDRLLVKSKALDQEIELERGPLKSIAKGKEMKRFAPLPPRKVVLFPYDVIGENAALIEPGDFESRYPLVWRYLSQNKKALEQRERGRMRGLGWYRYIYPKSMALFQRPKLLTADLANRMAFSLDDEGRYYLLGGAAGGYGLLPSRPELMRPLLALLNSTLLEWMLRPPGLSSPFRGGWYSCEARFINQLPIRLPSSPADLDALDALVARAVVAYGKLAAARADRDKTLAARQIASIEAELDDRVFRLYGVTADERRAVEEAVMDARAGVEAAQLVGADPDAT
jgi:hypothetical protein